MLLEIQIVSRQNQLYWITIATDKMEFVGKHQRLHNAQY